MCVELYVIQGLSIRLSTLSMHTFLTTNICYIVWETLIGFVIQI